MSNFFRVLCAVLSVPTVSVFATACGSDSTASGAGSVTVQLTDAPFAFDSVASVNVFVVRVDARTASTDSASAAAASDMSGWTTIASPNASFDLLTLSGGKTTNLGTSALATGTYNGFRLILDTDKSNVVLKNGTKPAVKWPSAGQTGLKINLDAPIAVTKDSSVIILDFDVGRSFVMRGNSISQNGLLFKPTIRAIASSATGNLSGSVHGDATNGPIVANATVEVLKAGSALSDTVSADVVRSGKTDASGNFALNFLLPGSYVLRATPPAGSIYKPAVLPTGITIASGATLSGQVIVLGR
jgi:hypothetical protein